VGDVSTAGGIAQQGGGPFEMACIGQATTARFHGVFQHHGTRIIYFGIVNTDGFSQIV
jgi:hypothetical protein